MGRENLWLEAGMGYVAAATTRDPDLGQELWPLFEQGDFQARAGFTITLCGTSGEG